MAWQEKSVWLWSLWIYQKRNIIDHLRYFIDYSVVGKKPNENEHKKSKNLPDIEILPFFLYPCLSEKFNFKSMALEKYQIHLTKRSDTDTYFLHNIFTWILMKIVRLSQFRFNSIFVTICIYSYFWETKKNDLKTVRIFLEIFDIKRNYWVFLMAPSMNLRTLLLIGKSKKCYVFIWNSLQFYNIPLMQIGRRNSSVLVLYTELCIRQSTLAENLNHLQYNAK